MLYHQEKGTPSIFTTRSLRHLNQKFISESESRINTVIDVVLQEFVFSWDSLLVKPWVRSALSPMWHGAGDSARDPRSKGMSKPLNVKKKKEKEKKGITSFIVRKHIESKISCERCEPWQNLGGVREGGSAIPKLGRDPKFDIRIFHPPTIDH